MESVWLTLAQVEQHARVPMADTWGDWQRTLVGGGSRDGDEGGDPVAAARPLDGRAMRCALHRGPRLPVRCPRARTRVRVAAGGHRTVALGG